ncbi:response regulator [Noviherbaspirillum aerium]|uniref:response regulator n=1 Tax=Noviherbaspirillum aerium TaxID=2588497 RepID=UPI00124C9774|nr:response regulator [Noviherbaspirillum aerium]
MCDPSLSQCLIGIVDDERAVRRGLSNLLKSAGYKTECFASGEALLECGQRADIDILILDIKLGGLDGFEIQSRLAASGLFVPVIFVSSYGDESVRKRAMGAGAAAFRSKPIDVDALLGDIEAVLEARRNR